MSKTYVIKLGGSAVSTQTEIFDTEYLNKFKETLVPFINNGDKFFIALGGGYAMRMYRDIASKGGAENTTDLHWIGTTVNVLHAYICKSCFNELSDDEVMKFEDYYSDKPITINKGVMFGGGGRPGHSGDVDAILAARKLGTLEIISMKNIDGVYSADPKKDPNAVRKDSISWEEYLQIIGNKKVHEPGGNYPIDPVATRMAIESKLHFTVLLASDLQNFKNALENGKFVGTKVGF